LLVQFLRSDVERFDFYHGSKIDEGLTELLLSGPVMTEEENENFKMAKKHFDAWTKTSKS
jgi:hypothetical protein